MSEEIFRKKSLDKIKSPENLNDYVRVSNPGVWLLMLSVVALLAGACIWGVFGRVEVTAEAQVFVSDGKAICRFDEDNAVDIKPGMDVTFGSYAGVIGDIDDDEEPGFVCAVSSDIPLEDGLYTGRIVISRIRPISFILN